MPWLSAKAFTGDGCSFMPRPAGRSGWVSTRGISNPAACKRASGTCANSGVPAKTTRIGGIRRGASSGPLLVAGALQHLGLDAVALQRAQVLDEHLAEQVVHLVLHAHREQAFGVELDAFA